MALDPSGLGGEPPRRRPPLYVIPMGIALVLAAFLGAAVGLVWQSSGLGEEPVERSAQSSAGAGDGARGAD